MATHAARVFRKDEGTKRAAGKELQMEHAWIS